MKKRKIFVSFIGSRGSGKTTIADKFTSHLDDLEFNIARQHRGLAGGVSVRGVWNAIVLWRYFDLEIMKKIGFCGRSPRAIPSLYRLYLPLAFSRDLSELGSKSDILIYDSNFSRGMMNALSLEQFEVSEIATFYENKILSKLDKMIIVVVETDPQVAIDRWLLRDEVNISEMESEKEIQERRQLKHVIDMVVEALSKFPKVQVIRLQGDQLPDNNARQLSIFFNDLT